MSTLFGQLEPADAAGRFVRVAVERGIERGAGEGLTYSAGNEPLEVGERVEVPLGRGDRKAAGIVVATGGAELLEGLSPDRVKRILRRTGSRLPGRLVDLAQWMSEYYVAPLGMVLATMMPAAVKRAIGRRTTVLLDAVPPDEAAQVIADARLPPTVAAAWAGVTALAPSQFPMEPRSLARSVGARNLGPINKLLRLGLLREAERESVRARTPPWEQLSVEQAVPSQGGPTPTPVQVAAIDGIGSTLGRFGVHLLRGVTGSGKTEVYLRLIAKVLGNGGSALVLVPEIALTPQTAGRFVERFEGQSPVAVLHSGLSAAQRHRQWALAASGEARVVVGARSAVFAPLDRLGLIVVDEEHDASGYKQDQVPRYNARDVAIKRGQVEGCPVVLGSATPSLESWANATGQGPGRFHLWELPERVGGGRLPRVEIVDMIEERRRRAVGESRLDLVGPTLAAAVRSTLGEGGQVILLLNRRGYSTYVCCTDARCGWVLQCDDCDAAMVVHRGGRLPRGELVRCHHCLAERLLPRTCPVCGRPVIELGMGTQQAEEELQRRFGAEFGLEAGRTLLRVDSDTMRTGRDYFESLARFARGEVRVLLGTQMIAKGLDFPNVRLVGVLNADTALSIPDFRAAERTFQLVSQVAGRAGRGAAPGRVVVQSVNPREPAIELAARHDYVSFAENELRLRRTSGLPPATRMARIVVREEDLEKARRRADDLSAAIVEAARGLRAPVRIMGPMPCPIARVAGQHRIGIELTAPRATDLHRTLARVRERGLLTSDAHTAVDMDPVALL